MANTVRVPSTLTERDFTVVLSDGMADPPLHAVERAATGNAAERLVWIGEEDRICRAPIVNAESRRMRVGATVEAMQDAMDKRLVDASQFCASYASERHSQKVRSG
jgi:hypothetical protein